MPHWVRGRTTRCQTAAALGFAKRFAAHPCNSGIVAPRGRCGRKQYFAKKSTTQLLKVRASDADCSHESADKPRYDQRSFKWAECEHTQVEVQGIDRRLICALINMSRTSALCQKQRRMPQTDASFDHRTTRRDFDAKCLRSFQLHHELEYRRSLKSDNSRRGGIPRVNHRS